MNDFAVMRVFRIRNWINLNFLRCKVRLLRFYKAPIIYSKREFIWVIFIILIVGAWGGFVGGQHFALWCIDSHMNQLTNDRESALAENRQLKASLAQKEGNRPVIIQKGWRGK